MNKQERKVWNKQYYITHLQEKKDYAKKYRIAHTEECKTYLEKYQKDYRKNKREERRQEKRLYYIKHRDEILERMRKWRINNPLKVKAHTELNEAIRKGIIHRQPCEICGNLKTHAHHEDYNKPLEVRWLCPLHHLGGVHYK